MNRIDSRITIRQALSSDNSDLLELIIQSQLFQKQELEKETIFDLELFKKDIRENFLKWISEADKIYFVAVNSENRIIGYIMCMIDKVVSNYVSLSDLYVIPEARRDGTARELTNQAISWSKDHDAREIVLAVNKNNLQAIELYESVGFTEKEDDYLYMKKTL